MKPNITHTSLLGAGWQTDNATAIVPDFVSNKTQVICGGRIQLVFETYVNPNNDFEVPRRVAVTGLDTARTRMTLMYPIPFPNSSRIESWGMSRYFKDLSLAKGQEHIEVLPEALVMQG